MTTTFNTQNMFKNDVYALFNIIKGIMIWSHKNSIEIEIKNIAANDVTFTDYVNNCSAIELSDITTVAWEMAKSTARLYASK